MAHGIDSLILAMDVNWLNSSTFNKLAELKQEAKAQNEPITGRIIPDDGSSPWLYTVKPHGGDGYEWLLTGCDLTMRIGNWMMPKSRPSIMTEVRSEMLWTHGPDACVKRIQTLLRSIGAQVTVLKVSRADLTVDVLLPASLWNMNLIEHLVKRADSMSPYFHNDHLTGIQIGKGKIMARFYDKPLEIRTKSHKDWMYDVWGIASVPEDHRIIRVEFQLRREVLKELGIEGFDNLTQKMPSLWAYCTREWLKVQDNPKLHHTQQTTLPWWVIVQGGMAGAQGACPAVRVKAIALDKQRNIQQMVGHAISMMALERQGEMLAPNETLDSASNVASVIALTLSKGMDDRELTRRVKHRQAKFMRAGVDFSKVGGSNIGIGVFSKRTRHTGNPS